MTVVEMGMLIHRVLSLVFYLCMHDLEKIEYPQNLEQFGHSCSDANNSFTCQSDDSFFIIADFITMHISIHLPELITLFYQQQFEIPL